MIDWAGARISTDASCAMDALFQRHAAHSQRVYTKAPGETPPTSLTFATCAFRCLQMGLGSHDLGSRAMFQYSFTKVSLSLNISSCEPDALVTTKPAG